MKIEVSSSIISSLSIKNHIPLTYNIGKVKSCELLQSSIHDVYLIETIQSKYILKIYKYQYKSVLEIAFEINFVGYLKASHLNVSSYIPKNDGYFILKINAPEGMRYAVLSTYAEGNELEYKQEKDAFWYGLHVGKIHKVSKAFIPRFAIKEINIELILETSIKTIEYFLCKEYHTEWKYFHYFFKLLTNKINFLEIDKLEKTFCHGDLHGGNAHEFLDDLSFFDFDFCGYGLIAYDISIFRWGCMIMRRDWQWQHFIQGYRTTNLLDDNELKHSLLFVALHDLWVMHLYLSRIDTMGQLSIHKFYIHKRIEFLKNLEKQI